MKDSKEKGIAIILGKLAKEKKPAEGPAEEGDDYAAAAEEVMSAIEAKDAEGLGQALKSFITMCQAEG
jgi:hypothetical protein